MGRKVDQVYERTRHAEPPFLEGEIRAGLANGSMVRGVTRRTARGFRMVPRQGALLPPAGLEIDPPLGPGQVAVAWEVIEAPATDQDGWSAVVVGIRQATLRPR